MDGDAEHLSIWSLIIRIFAFLKCPFISFARFIIGSFLNCILRVLYIIWIEVLYQISNLQILFPSLERMFSLHCLLKKSACAEVTKILSIFSSRGFLVLAFIYRSVIILS